jgi:hypothetical protein
MLPFLQKQKLALHSDQCKSRHVAPRHQRITAGLMTCKTMRHFDDYRP